MNALPIWAALYSIMNDEQLWMLHVGLTVLAAGLFVGLAWTAWDVLRPMFDFDEEPQAAALAGLTIVQSRRAPKRPRQTLAEPARSASHAADGTGLLGLNADLPEVVR